MKQYGEKDSVVQIGGDCGVSVDYPTDDINEQYRIMAQMEANIRIMDNTGFDMAEYKEQVQLLEKKRQQQQPQSEGRYHTKPKPKLPDVHHVSGSNKNSLLGEGPSRPEEPPLPFTRANRRYVQTGRGIHNRVKVPEISAGVVVPKNSLALSAISNGKEHIVKCWGCSSGSETYLRVNVLSTLVQCPACSTISPVT